MLPPPVSRKPPPAPGVPLSGHRALHVSFPPGSASLLYTRIRQNGRSDWKKYLYVMSVQELASIQFRNSAIRPER